MTITLIIIAVLYVLLLGGLIVGYQKIVLFKSASTATKTEFSIVIPFRNEEQNLPDLLLSLQNIQYDKNQFEILFVNDASEDNSVTVIEHFITENQLFSWKVIQNNRQSQSPKKDAITTAVSRARFPWIITTDADCKVSPFWLQRFDAFIQQSQPVLVVGPVQFVTTKKTPLHQFQIQESIVLNSVTVGAFGWGKPFMCNGANLTYLKSAFAEIDGFSGNNHISSGDDVFLLQKMKNHFPERVKYLQSTDVIVTTQTENSWKKMLSQRIRWAAKTSAYSVFFPKILGIVTLLMNLGLYLSLLLLPEWQWFVALFLLKLTTDSFLLFPNARFFKIRISPFSFLLNSLLYPGWIIVVFLGTRFVKTQWKGRDFVK